MKTGSQHLGLWKVLIISWRHWHTSPSLFPLQVRLLGRIFKTRSTKYVFFFSNNWPIFAVNFTYRWRDKTAQFRPLPLADAWEARTRTDTQKSTSTYHHFAQRITNWHVNSTANYECLTVVCNREKELNKEDFERGLWGERGWRVDIMGTWCAQVPMFMPLPLPLPPVPRFPRLLACELGKCQR